MREVATGSQGDGEGVWEQSPLFVFKPMDEIKDNENAWSPVWIGLLGIVPVVVIGVVAIAASLETSMRVHSEVERSFGEKVVDQEKMRAYAECIKIEALSGNSRQAMAYRFACDSLKKEALQGS